MTQLMEKAAPSLKPAGDAAAGASAAAQAKADAFMKDDALARSKGETPAQVEARRRVAALFCDIHLPGETPDARAARLSEIDCALPVTTINARGVDVNNAKSKGFMGLGRKPAYFTSLRYPPKKPEDPIYALEYIPLKK